MDIIKTYYKELKGITWRWTSFHVGFASFLPCSIVRALIIFLEKREYISTRFLIIIMDDRCDFYYSLWFSDISEYSLYYVSSSSHRKCPRFNLFLGIFLWIFIEHYPRAIICRKLRYNYFQFIITQKLGISTILSQLFIDANIIRNRIIRSKFDEWKSNIQ